MLTIVNLDLVQWIEPWDGQQVRIEYETNTLYRKPSELALYSSHLTTEQVEVIREHLLEYEKENSPS